METNECQAAHLPADRRRALATDGEISGTLQGAALLADIAGFSRLTDDLVHRWGPRRGAEELSRELDRIYGALVAEVHREGGCVVSYAGDAIQCWFDGDDGHRAHRCAFRLQGASRHIAQDRRARGDQPLGIKVAFTVGPARRMVVGDPAIQRMDLLAGSTVDRLALIAKSARSGEVLCDPETLRAMGREASASAPRALGGQRQALVLEPPAASPPSPPQPDAPPSLDAEQLRPWVIAPVRARLHAGQEAYLSALSTATVLFLGFSGLDYDHDPAVEAKLDRFVRWVQATLAPYESWVLSVMTGDKGSHLYAAFGAPVAHQDDTRRAVAATASLLALPDELSFVRGLRMGVAGGDLLAGTYGSPIRRTYGVLGAPVNRAALLMEWADPGTMLAEASVSQAVTGFRWSAARSVPQKGSDEPLMAQRLMGHADPTERMGDGSPMVGREEHISLLEGDLDALRDGSTLRRTVILEGEAGIGKSRLLAALRDRIRDRGMTPLLGLADAIEQHKAYFAWRPVFSKVLDLPEPATLAQRREAAADRIATLLENAPERERAMALLALLNPVLVTDFEETPQSRAQRGESRADNALELMVLILRAHLERGGPTDTVLLIEDAHWLDSASWALLGRVSREISPSLLVVTTRPLGDRPQPDYHRLLGQDTTEVRHLDDLSEAQAIELAALRLGVDELPVDVIRFLLDRAQGHPFFIEELAYAMRDEGLIEIREGRCRLAVEPSRLAELDFPRTIEGIIAGRVARLSPEEQIVIKTASVVGRIFGFHVLESIQPEDKLRQQLGSLLEHLERLHLTPKYETDPDDSYIFKHVITQQVAYNLLLYEQRQRLHRAIAAWYEASFADQLDPYLPLLVHHWRAADDLPKAISYLDRAGRQALHEGAFQEAIDFLGEALELDDQLPTPGPLMRRVEWRRLRADAWFNLGRLEHTVGEVSRSLALMGQHPPHSQLAWISLILSELLVHPFLLALPSPFQIRNAQRRQRAVEETMLWARQGEALYYMLKPLPLVGSSLRAVNLSMRVGNNPVVSRAFSLLALVSGPSRLRFLTEHYLTRAAKLADDDDNPANRAFSLFCGTAYLVGYAAWSDGLRRVRQALDILAPLHNRQDNETAWAMAFIVYYWSGRYQEYRKAAETVFESANARANQQHAAWGIFSRARHLLRLGQSAKAVTEATEGARMLREVQDDLDASLAAATGAMARLRLGDLPGALATAEEVGLLYWGRIPTSVVCLDALEGLLEVTLAAWERAVRKGSAEARDLRRKVQLSLQAQDKHALLYPVGVSSKHLYRGRALEIRGKLRAARRRYRKGAAAAERMAMPYHQALALFHLGRISDDAERERRLDEAERLFQDLGCADQLLWIAQARRGERSAPTLGVEGHSRRKRLSIA
jgi:class 3 adenylate cyclase/tetratricopeptide (TPR) repeat protein